MSFSSLLEFTQRLEREGELTRISLPVRTDLEITALADREMKSPGGGKALLIEKPILADGRVSEFPVLINALGSKRRMNLALNVETIDTVSDQIAYLLKAKPPSSLSEAWELLKNGIDVIHTRPNRVSTGPCKEVVHRFDQPGTNFGLQGSACPEMLAGRWRPLCDPAHRLHSGSRQWIAQYRHVPDAGLRCPQHRYALADA